MTNDSVFPYSKTWREDRENMAAELMGWGIIILVVVMLFGSLFWFLMSFTDSNRTYLSHHFVSDYAFQMVDGDLHVVVGTGKEEIRLTETRSDGPFHPSVVYHVSPDGAFVLKGMTHVDDLAHYEATGKATEYILYLPDAGEFLRERAKWTDQAPPLLGEDEHLDILLDTWPLMTE